MSEQRMKRIAITMSLLFAYSLVVNIILIYAFEFYDDEDLKIMTVDSQAIPAQAVNITEHAWISKARLELPTMSTLQSQATDFNQSIFVILPSLNDYGCVLTINELFHKATHPENMFVGIYQQNEETKHTPDCLQMLTYCDQHTRNEPVRKTASYSHRLNNHPEIKRVTLDITTLCKYADHIMINRTTVADGARGVPYSRYQAFKLYDIFQQTYNQSARWILLSDAHNVYHSNWDRLMIEQWRSIRPDPEHAVMTVYPISSKDLTPNSSMPPYHICGSSYVQRRNHMLQNSDGCWVPDAGGKPSRTAFWAGGFNFAASHFWEKVPYDPHLLYVFDGDEMNIATRGWTHGYDFYSPHVHMVGHYYTTDEDTPLRRNPHLTEQANFTAIQDRAEKRINYLWQNWKYFYPDLKPPEQFADLQEIERYALGTKRSIQQFWKWIGVDPQNLTTTRFKEEVLVNGGLPYVAYSA